MVEPNQGDAVLRSAHTMIVQVLAASDNLQKASVYWYTSSLA